MNKPHLAAELARRDKRRKLTARATQRPQDGLRLLLSALIGEPDQQTQVPRPIAARAKLPLGEMRTAHAMRASGNAESVTSTAALVPPFRAFAATSATRRRPRDDESSERPAIQTEPASFNAEPAARDFQGSIVAASSEFQDSFAGHATVLPAAKQAAMPNDNNWFTIEPAAPTVVAMSLDNEQQNASHASAPRENALGEIKAELQAALASATESSQRQALVVSRARLACLR